MMRFIGLVMSILFLGFFSFVGNQNNAFAQVFLDQSTASVCMSVDVRASITGLNDIAMFAQGEDGQSGALYRGVATFTLEANAPVELTVTQISLVNGVAALTTSVDIDGGGPSYRTSGTGSHFAQHDITVTARLGAISDQLAGQYSAQAILTVVPQITLTNSCYVVEVIDSPVETEPFQVVAESNDQITAEALFEQEHQYLVAQIDATIPPQLRWALTAPQGPAQFPFLVEYLAWVQRDVVVLTDRGRYWWMFPIQQLQGQDKK